MAFGEMADFRTGARNTQDESGAFCSARKLVNAKSKTKHKKNAVCQSDTRAN